MVKRPKDYYHYYIMKRTSVVEVVVILYKRPIDPEMCYVYDFEDEDAYWIARSFLYFSEVDAVQDNVERLSKQIAQMKYKKRTSQETAQLQQLRERRMQMICNCHSDFIWHWYSRLPRDYK